jgi:excisionase family DNA binding protein
VAQHLPLARVGALLYDVAYPLSAVMERVGDMQKNGAEIEKLPPVLTVARVADIAGVSRRTVRLWVKEGKLPATKMQSNGSARLYFETAMVLRALGVEVSE